ncbi:hypothetical protein BKA80DRAFT_26001 [Phyllosticta citrichinensis]
MQLPTPKSPSLRPSTASIPPSFETWSDSQPDACSPSQSAQSHSSAHPEISWPCAALLLHLTPCASPLVESGWILRLNRARLTCMSVSKQPSCRPEPLGLAASSVPDSAKSVARL